jgi:DNA uptake protein ComE-like DNA-binding protein
MNRKRSKVAGLTLLGLVLATPAVATAQLGRQQGLVEPNVAQDAAMLALPGLNAAAVDAIKESRPILSVTALDALLGTRGLSTTQRSELYRRMFVHVDVNRGSDAELLLIPGMTPAAVSEIKAGRPWRNFEQFATTLGRTRPADEVRRLEQYFFIPIDLNTWTEPIMDSFASIGVGTSRWKREFAEYRPWTSMAQFEREIGKYVRGNPDELKRLQRYVIINP